MKAYSKKYRQCSLHDVKCLRDNRRKCDTDLENLCQILFGFYSADVFSSLKPPEGIAALNESSIGMECVCPPTCSELVCQSLGGNHLQFHLKKFNPFDSNCLHFPLHLQRYEVQSILSRRYPEDKLNTTTSG